MMTMVWILWFWWLLLSSSIGMRGHFVHAEQQQQQQPHQQQTSLVSWTEVVLPPSPTTTTTTRRLEGAVAEAETVVVTSTISVSKVTFSLHDLASYGSSSRSGVDDYDASSHHHRSPPFVDDYESSSSFSFLHPEAYRWTSPEGFLRESAVVPCLLMAFMVVSAIVITTLMSSVDDGDVEKSPSRPLVVVEDFGRFDNQYDLPIIRTSPVPPRKRLSIVLETIEEQLGSDDDDCDDHDDDDDLESLAVVATIATKTP